MVVDEIIRLLDHIKSSGDLEHPRRQRVFAGLWGSLVFHLALWAFTVAHPQVNVEVVAAVSDAALIVLPVYSAVFGTIVAFGVPRGSLVRHFVYGVLLPAFAYGLAGTLMGVIGGGLGSVGGE